MNNLPGFDILKTYRPMEILKSALLGLIVYLVYGALLLTPTIVISLLYVPYMLYFFLAMYIMMSLVASRGITIFIETLMEYQQSTIDFDTFQKRTSVIMAIITFIILAMIYQVYVA